MSDLVGHSLVCFKKATPAGVSKSIKHKSKSLYAHGIGCSALADPRMGKERTFLSDLAKREGEDQIHPAGVMLFSLSYRLVDVYVNQNNCKCSYILDGFDE
jgi:hypothetical protein